MDTALLQFVRTFFFRNQFVTHVFDINWMVSLITEPYQILLTETTRELVINQYYGRSKFETK